MSRQVIKCPDGTHAVWSDGSTDGIWIRWGMSREEYIETAAGQAAHEARKGAERLLAEVDEHGSSWPPPYGLSFEQANADSVENGGPNLIGKEPNAG